MTMSAPPVAMTIAGSDSGGGAGVQADLKTFAALGVFGTCAITAITAQNTTGVKAIYPLPPEAVEAQIEAVLSDMPVRAVKTGMLYSRAIMARVADCLERHELRPVVDPVLRAGSGDLLVRPGDASALVELIVPRALVLTPNRFEAEDISGLRIRDVGDAKEAAREIARLGPEAVLVKGGHLEGAEAIDILFWRGRFYEFKRPRLAVRPHGAGCSFSAAITAFLAKGADILGAAKGAEELMDYALRFAVPVGHGREPVNPLARLYNEAERYRVLEEVREAAKLFERSEELHSLVPEVGSQIVMALPHPTGPSDVVALDGRIVRTMEGVRVGEPRFGASSHMARVVLTVMRFDPTVRAALNLRYDEELVRALEEAGLRTASFDRAVEPEEIRAVEGATLPWGVEEAMRSTGGVVPDVIYDRGGLGKEPMVRVLAHGALEVVEKVLEALRDRMSHNRKEGNRIA